LSSSLFCADIAVIAGKEDADAGKPVEAPTPPERLLIVLWRLWRRLAFFFFLGDHFRPGTFGIYAFVNVGWGGKHRPNVGQKAL